MTRAVVVVGDALLDRDVDGDVERVCPDAPAPVVDVVGERARPGGAGLAAVLAARAGADVTFVTATARDQAGALLRHLLARAGVHLVDLGLDGSTPEKLRVRAAGRSLVRIDRGGELAAIGGLAHGAAGALERADAVLVADYGRGVTANPQLRALLAAAAASTPLVWDPHPRGSHAVDSAHVVTPNERELAALTQSSVATLADTTSAARRLARAWGAGAVAVTRGGEGALVAQVAGAPLVVPARAIETGDPCGAGDCFAAATAVALAHGAVLSEAVEVAVADAADFVARGGAAAVEIATPGGHELRDEAKGTAGAAEVVERIRRRGGIVVATGGCFDLLHAGHVAMLRAARRLGDCLVVLLNSDQSVRRLKGPDRPLQPARDRAAVLAALDCVDAVEVFDSDTPVPALERLRPDVFAKGGDYAVGALPEAAALARWGGQAVVLPYLAGRSTTRLLEEAARRVR